MLLSQIRDEVKSIVKDPVFTDEMLNSYINRAYFAGVGEARLPEYKLFGTLDVTAADYMVAVTDYVDDYNKLLKFINKDIRVYTSLEDMIGCEGIEGLGLIGTAVQAVALEGNNWWYYPSADQTLNFTYFANPQPLIKDRDAVTLFPELIQQKIMVHGACIPCFEVIEDAAEGPKANVIYHKALYNEGVLKLQEWNGRRRNHNITSRWGA